MARPPSGVRETIRLAHVCSSDLGILPLLPFCTPLLARGWEITMITPPGPNVERATALGMTWLPLALRRRMHLASDVHGSLQLASYFRRGRYDIVHTHNIKTGHIGRVVASAMRVPIVVHTIQGMAYSQETPPVMRAVHGALERIASLGCDYVFSQSREDRDTYLASHVIAPDKLEVIGNGIDLAKYSPRPTDPATRAAVRSALGLAAGDILFLSAGRLIVEKGFVELFEAAIAAARIDPRIRLAVAGPSDERVDALEPASLDAARAQGILLLGQRSDMRDLYCASDVVVLASWHEGMPRVLMEGAAMGKPLLATDVRGCREVVEPPKHGLRVPMRDAKALADAMVRLAADAAWRSQLGRENASEARERYAIERAVERVDAAYDRLLAARDAR